MKFMEAFYTIGIIVFLILNFVTLMKSKKTGEIIHYYKLGAVTWIKSLNYLCYAAIISILVLLVHTFIYKPETEYKIIVQMLFWGIACSINLVNIPRFYYVTDIGLVNYGITKYFVRLFKWENIKRIEWDTLDKLVFHINVDGVKLRIKCKTNSINLDDLKRHLGKYNLVGDKQ